jgi:hypothetical protein
MGKVITLSGPTTLDIPVERVLDSAKVSCTRVFILGEEADGTPYYAASFGDTRELLWWLETFKAKLLAGDFARE